MEDLTGRQFGPYQIVAPLGEGGMAAVYKAYQPSMERYVALKVLPRQMAQSEEFLARFRREARLLAQLQHPHILPVFDYGEADGYTYIVMPFVQSGTLAHLLKARRLTYPEIRRIIVQIADALGYAHARGMIHRDVKPSNVLLDERGNCLLTDFGLARMAEPTSMLTSSGAIMGTPAYMSPEQGAGGTVDNRSDIYSLGVILYEMVTGRVPYSAETPIAVVFKHIQDPLPPARNFAPDLPDALELVLLKSLAKRPEDRYQTTDEFVHAIEEALPRGSAVGMASPAYDTNLPTMMEPTPRPPSRPPSVVPPAVPPASRPPSTAPLDTHPLSQPPYPSAVSARPRKGAGIWGWIGAGVVIFGLIGLAVLALGVNLVRNRIQSAAIPSAATSPSATPLEATAPTAAEPPLQPTNTSAPLEALVIKQGRIYSAEFRGEPGPGWEWQQGTLLAQERISTRMLLRPAPQGDFEMTGFIRSPRFDKFHLGGLVLYENDENQLIFGYGTCRLPNLCIGEGLYFFSLNQATLAQNSFATKILGNELYLRLQRSGNLFLAAYSLNRTDWKSLGTHERNFSDLRIGVLEAPPTGEVEFFSFTLKEAAQAIVRQEVECFSSPDIGSEIRGVFTMGETISLVGRSADSEWVVAHTPGSPQELCWIHFSIKDRAELVTSMPVIEPVQKAEALPEPPPLVIPAGQKFVRINSITLNAQNQYVVQYETFEYTETLPGTHIHFFFDTVPFDQAGAPGKGPWKVYGGPRPFSGYRASDRPANAAQLCALVANPNHSVLPNSGHCFPLPDVASVTARTDTECKDTPTGNVVARFRAGTIALLKGISADRTWLLTQNPEKRDASTCWIPFDAAVLNGELSAVPTVNP
ncbi:MAG: protein kinase [Anaerolineales bacterium]|nr:protein kinase [Anaerolineales bacterium]